MSSTTTSQNRLIPIVRKVLNATYYVSPKLAGRLCYRVLTTPPSHEPDAAEETFIEEATSDYLDIGQVQAAIYHWYGNGKKVLLAHGWDSYSGRWYELGRRLLAAGCDVYAIDAPGHGRTRNGSFSVAHYAEFLAAFASEVKPHLVVGHSAGGMASIYYHKAFPTAHKPQKLALLGTPAHLTDFIESFRQTIGLRHEVIDALEKDFIRRWQNPFSYYSMADFARELTVPGLIVHDKQDDIAPSEGAYQIAKNWPQAELYMTEGMGHKLQTEAVWERVLSMI